MRQHLAIFALFLLAVLPKSDAEIYSAELNNSFAGWLYQYEPEITNSFGGNACVPTCAVNAMTYLQNSAPGYFGTQLTGSSYSDWINTDLNLGLNYLMTTPTGGTTTANTAPGLQRYFNDKNFNDVLVTQQVIQQNIVSTDVYYSSLPTVSFFKQALTSGIPVLFGYASGSLGHELLATGLDWNDSTNSGTIRFINPLFASLANSPNGPALVTTGNLSFLPSLTIPFTDNGTNYQAIFSNALSISYPYDNGVQSGLISSAVSFTSVSGYAFGTIPEPSFYSLFGIGVSAFIVFFRRRAAS
jgi:hypothetical protein